MRSALEYLSWDSHAACSPNDRELILVHGVPLPTVGMTEASLDAVIEDPEGVTALLESGAPSVSRPPIFRLKVAYKVLGLTQVEVSGRDPAAMRVEEARCFHLLEAAFDAYERLAQDDTAGIARRDVKDFNRKIEDLQRMVTYQAARRANPSVLA